MPTITPPSIAALPAAPDPNNRATFNTLAYPWSAALPQFSTQISDLGANVKANADDAATSASAAGSSASSAATEAFNASVSAANAATASAAPMWVTGTTYALGAATWSPANRMVYRKITASSVSNTDPSTDPANWSLLGTIGLSVVTVTGTTQAAVNNGHYVLTNVAATTVTLPAGAEGATVAVTTTGTLTTNVIARNGADTIMEVAENMTLDKADVTVTLRFMSNSWRVI